MTAFVVRVLSVTPPPVVRIAAPMFNPSAVSVSEFAPVVMPVVDPTVPIAEVKPIDPGLAAKKNAAFDAARPKFRTVFYTSCDAADAKREHFFVQEGTWWRTEALCSRERADRKQCAERWGDCAIAAAFLEAYVDKRPWLHLDIAGVSYNEGSPEWPAYHPKNGA